MVPLDESRRRTTAMQQRLRENGLDGALFILPIDVYYYAGTRQNSTLWLPAEGEPMLLVRKSYARAKEESPLADVRPFPASKDFPALLGAPPGRSALPSTRRRCSNCSSTASSFPGGSSSTSPALTASCARSSRPSSWSGCVEAAAASCSVFAAVPEFLKRGMREIDIAAEIECRLRKAGSEGYVRMRAYNQELFMGLAVSASAASYGFVDGPVSGRGLSSASPQGASRELIRENEPILLDYCFVHEGYITDMARVFVFGALDAELQRAFDRRAGNSGRPAEGVASRAPSARSCSSWRPAMAERGRASARTSWGCRANRPSSSGTESASNWTSFRSLRQGVKAPLQAGQTIAMEPKFVIPGKGGDRHRKHVCRHVGRRRKNHRYAGPNRIAVITEGITVAEWSETVTLQSSERSRRDLTFVAIRARIFAAPRRTGGWPLHSAKLLRKGKREKRCSNRLRVMNVAFRSAKVAIVAFRSAKVDAAFAERKATMCSR